MPHPPASRGGLKLRLGESDYLMSHLGNTVSASGRLSSFKIVHASAGGRTISATSTTTKYPTASGRA